MKLTVEEIKNVIEKAEKHIEELQSLLSTVEVEPGRVARRRDRLLRAYRHHWGTMQGTPGHKV